MSRFLVPSKATLAQYVPGEQPKRGEFIKLNTNENPFEPPKRAIDYIAKVAKGTNIYNDTRCGRLTDVFASYYNIDKENVIFSNGSDEVLAFCYLAYCDNANALQYPEITYGFYSVFSQLFNIAGQEIPLKQDLTIDISDYFDCKKTVLIANPNAPTGIVLPVSQIEQIVVNNPDNIVIVDEAYADFAKESALYLTKKYDNLIVVGTFSKSRSLAGARLGYAVADSTLIADLNRIKFSFNPYNVNAMTQELGAISIEEDGYFKDCIDRIVTTRDEFVAAIAQLGFNTLPSGANFVFTCHNTIAAKQIYDYLRENKILVRHFNADKISNYLRISIGSAEDMAEVVRCLKRLV